MMLVMMMMMMATTTPYCLSPWYLYVRWRHRRYGNRYEQDADGSVIYRPTFASKVGDFIRKYSSFLGYQPDRELYEWIQRQLPDFRITRSSVLWSDGILLCALLESICPGSCPGYDLLKKTNRYNNCKLALRIAHEYIGITQDVIDAEELAGYKRDVDRKLCRLLSLIKWAAAELEPNETSHVTTANRSRDRDVCSVSGCGLSVGIVKTKCKFDVHVPPAVDVDVLVVVTDPDGRMYSARITSVFLPSRSAANPIWIPTRRRAASLWKIGAVKTLSASGRCHSFRSGGDEASNDPERVVIDHEPIEEGRIRISYTPIVTGLHRLEVKWHQQHVTGSPFRIRVADSLAELNEEDSQIHGLPRITDHSSAEGQWHESGQFRPSDNNDGAEDDLQSAVMAAVLNRTSKVQRSVTKSGVTQTTGTGKEVVITKRRVLRRIMAARGQEVVLEEVNGSVKDTKLSANDTSSECLCAKTYNARHGAGCDKNAALGADTTDTRTRPDQWRHLSVDSIEKDDRNTSGRRVDGRPFANGWATGGEGRDVTPADGSSVVDERLPTDHDGPTEGDGQRVDDAEEAIAEERRKMTALTTRHFRSRVAAEIGEVGDDLWTAENGWPRPLADADTGGQSRDDVAKITPTAPSVDKWTQTTKDEVERATGWVRPAVSVRRRRKRGEFETGNERVSKMLNTVSTGPENKYPITSLNELSANRSVSVINEQLMHDDDDDDDDDYDDNAAADAAGDEDGDDEYDCCGDDDDDDVRSIKFARHNSDKVPYGEEQPLPVETSANGSGKDSLTPSVDKSQTTNSFRSPDSLASVTDTVITGSDRLRRWRLAYRDRKYNVPTPAEPANEDKGHPGGQTGIKSESYPETDSPCLDFRRCHDDAGRPIFGCDDSLELDRQQESDPRITGYWSGREDLVPELTGCRSGSSSDDVEESVDFGISASRRQDLLLELDVFRCIGSSGSDVKQRKATTEGSTACQRCRSEAEPEPDCRSPLSPSPCHAPSGPCLRISPNPGNPEDPEFLARAKSFEDEVGQSLTGIQKTHDPGDVCSTCRSPEGSSREFGFCIPDPMRCKAFGVGLKYGTVDTKNMFQISAPTSGLGCLTVGIVGPRGQVVKETSLTFTGDDLYEVTYDVSQSGIYLINIKWCDYNIPGSPFVCRVSY